MAEKYTYKVLRPLDADRAYAIGDTRDLTEADAKHLVDLGAIEKVSGKAAKATPAEEHVEFDAKAEEAPLNKAEAAAPAKKGRRG